MKEIEGTKVDYNYLELRAVPMATLPRPSTPELPSSSGQWSTPLYSQYSSGGEAFFRPSEAAEVIPMAAANSRARAMRMEMGAPEAGGPPRP